MKGKMSMGGGTTRENVIMRSEQKDEVKRKIKESKSKKKEIKKKKSGDGEEKHY